MQTPDNATGKKNAPSPVAAILRPACTLLAICAIVSAALAGAYAITKDAIEASELAAANAMRAEVMPEADFEQAELPPGAADSGVSEIYRAVGPGGEGMGYVATASSKGYGGDVTVIVGVNEDGSVSGARISEHNETPGLGANAAKPGFHGQYSDRPTDERFVVVKGESGHYREISAISGATITSSAMTDAVNAAVAAINTMREGASQ